MPIGRAKENSHDFDIFTFWLLNRMRTGYLSTSRGLKYLSWTVQLGRCCIRQVLDCLLTVEKWV